ncbi:serine--tRNA ligase, mitochondrial [Drosophila grimshawi]|uniref:serine--tRNA ligase n=1 Tax=Drosophila grimshawi TaxID=7222 RepID=B4JS06_DROGR|nr:serine--tRNA ligase, mitochondrial [Drosophila grimshawi]EDV94546.1 GH19144 [Drosophila grimshawi]
MKLLTNVRKLLLLQQSPKQRLITTARTITKISQPHDEAEPALTSSELDELERNCEMRHHKNNIPLIRQLVQALHSTGQTGQDQEQTRRQLEEQLELLPNATHPRLLGYDNQPLELANYKHRVLPEQGVAKEFSDLARALNLYRMDHLGNYTGHKSYYLTGQLAMMEQAIIQYALQSITRQGFKLISVPDILPRNIIEACGMRTEGERTQVYKLDTGECLSGTSEMALAGFFAQRQLAEQELPVKVAAVSRCYRAETSGLHEEKGIYRVHQFTKVEMFAIATPEQSEQILEQFKNTEIALFKQLGINFRLLDMPPCELGAPAYQKYDIEAWMPGRQMWGEISSCSNCTDYQAKRLQIKYRRDSDGSLAYAHTINGTATAIPRLLIALIESYQGAGNGNGNDSIQIPEVLVPFMNGQRTITKNKKVPEIKLVKFIKST